MTTEANILIAENRLDEYKKFFGDTRRHLSKNAFTSDILGAIMHGNVEVLNFLDKVCKFSALSSAFDYIDQLDCHGMDLAVKYQQFEVLKWFHANRKDQILTSKSAIHIASSKTFNLDMLKWMVENRKEYQLSNKARIQFNSYLLTYICANGNLDLLQYLFANMPEFKPLAVGPDLKAAMFFYAVRFEHLHVLQFLNSKPGFLTEPLPAHVFDFAALSRSTDIIKWLEKNRPEFALTFFAGDSAAEVGNIEMLEWLCTNRPEYQLIQKAGEQTVQIAHPEKYQGFKDALRRASTTGMLDALTWLFTNRPELTNSSVFGNADIDVCIKLATENNHPHVVDYLNSKLI